MAIRARLTLNGKEYEVKSFGQKFTQYVRASDNRPNFQVQFGHLEIILETPDNNEVLELMLHAKHNPNVEGVLEVWTSEDMPLRRIKFSEGFIIYYKDTFNLRSKEGMTTRFVIAAWQMEINKFPMHRPQMGYSWIKKPREIKPLPEKTYAPPIPLVRKVRIEKPLRPCFFVGENITLTVTQYNISVSESDKNKVLWKTKIDDKLADFKTSKKRPFKGERISFTIPKEWVNKEICIMPYLKKPNNNIRVLVKVTEGICQFINGMEIAIYICNEIKANCRKDITKSMRNSYSLERKEETFIERLAGLADKYPKVKGEFITKTTVLAQFASLVRPHGDWDHKGLIKSKQKGKEYSCVTIDGERWNIKFDLWSNIHYGFMGQYIGISEHLLRNAAGLVQYLTNSSDDVQRYKNMNRSRNVGIFERYDDPNDSLSIIIGIELYNMFKDNVNQLTPEDIVRAIIAKYKQNPLLSVKPCSLRH